MSLVVFLILCSLTTFVLAILTFLHTLRLWRLRPVQWLLALTASFSVGSYGAFMTFIVPSFAEKLFFFELRVLGMVFMPPLWLLFLGAVFDRWRWLQRREVVALLLAPTALNFVLLLLPATRPFFFTDFAPYTYGEVSLLAFKHGPWYRIFYIWSMLLMLLSYVMSAVAFWRERGFRRRQVLILNAGLGVALVMALIPMWLPNSEEMKWILSSTVSLACTQIGILYAVLRQRLLNLIPLAAVRIFRKFPDPVLVIDDHGLAMGASDRAISLFALPRNFLGQPVAELLPELRLAPGEQTLTDSQNRPHHFHLAVEALGEAGSSPGNLVFFRDIGAQKQVERQLHEGMEFRARLLAFLAHDLTGFLENQAVLSLALQEKLDERYPQVELLTQSAQASQELVANVMAWVKSQALRFQPVRRSFEWSMLLRESLEQMESRFKTKHVEMVFESGQSPLLGNGDSEMLAAVIRNLVSNALRATPERGRVCVRLEPENGNARVSVRDEGTGMESAELDRILEATREFSLAGMPRAQGSGIGLRLARYFIAVHGGTFRMESRLGSGTEVSFTVPL